MCAPIAVPGVDGCPSSKNVGQVCMTSGEMCDQGGGSIAGCGECVEVCMFPSTWSFASPPAAPCPPIAPDLGQSCTVPSTLTCTYGFCGSETGTNRQCMGGVWVDVGELCPG
jgi:hypothetical protein